MTTASAEGQMVPWWLVLLQGIAAIIIGVLLLTNTAATVAFLVLVLGFYWLISGIFAIIGIFIDSTQWGWKLFMGILGIIAGIIVIQHPLVSTVVVPTVTVWLIGLLGIVIGVGAVIAMVMLGDGASRSITNNIAVVLIQLQRYDEARQEILRAIDSYVEGVVTRQAELVDFLETGPPPVYVGFGSMSNRDPEATAALVLDALAQVGQRGGRLLSLGGSQQAQAGQDKGGPSETSF